MENYYEYLEIDMNASTDEILSAIENKSSGENAVLSKTREVKSILLNENAKKIYDEKLINFILNKGKASNTVVLSNAKHLLTIDNTVVHDKYIWIVIALFIIGILSGSIFSITVNLTINFLINIAQLIILYMDWKLLQSHGKANFSKWWILFSPVYIFKRCTAIGSGRKLFFIWMGIILVYSIGAAVFHGSTAILESSACEVVTNIYQKQFNQYSTTCKNVTITQTEGKEHYGMAELSNGSTRGVYITEASGGQIYVKLD
ncbi:hypothetical protein OLZ31_18045 [Enterobacter asburiae]|nr:hypothetical protein [Enterobacter asburiae]